MSNETKNIKVENNLSVDKQRKLYELNRNLCQFFNEEEFIQIINVYNNVINRLVKQAESEGIEI